MNKCRAFDVWLDKRLCEMEAIGLDEAFYAGRQSRQAEFDAMTEALLNQTQLLAKQKVEVEEKDKRIESALYVLKGLKAENDLWGCDQIEVQIEILEKALRGEHE